MLREKKKINYAKEIQRLKKEKNAIILAHVYQSADIQEVADFVGDSLGLSKEAAGTTASLIVFAGVHFMAETAKIVNPTKKVIVPDLSASCSLAESCSAEAFKLFRSKYPDHITVSYINCSAEVKAQSDIIVTSANAKKIIEALPAEWPILFTPDRNLGKYLMKETGREMVLWDGACVVHESFSLSKLIALLQKYPQAKLIAHPESEPDILDLAHFIGSTSAMMEFVKSSEHDTFLVATEAGILHQLKKESTGKTLIPVPVKEDNTCACSECAYMKVNTLEKLYQCLLNEGPEIKLTDDLIENASIPLERMFALSN
jgi:quinolinate synthase